MNSLHIWCSHKNEGIFVSGLTNTGSGAARVFQSWNGNYDRFPTRWRLSQLALARTHYERVTVYRSAGHQFLLLASRKLLVTGCFSMWSRLRPRTLTNLGWRNKHNTYFRFPIVCVVFASPLIDDSDKLGLLRWTCYDVFKHFLFHLAGYFIRNYFDTRSTVYNVL